MSRDVWLKQLRIAGADVRSVEDALTGDVPVDGLQHAGSAVLRAERSEALVDIAGRLIDALRDRGWTGDAELIAELEHYANRNSSDLISLPVELDELGEALDQSAGSESYIDVNDGALWPAQLFDVDQGPDDFDAESDRWLLVVGLGSRSAYGSMQRFIATIDDPVLARAPHRCDRRVRRVSTVPVRTQSPRRRVHPLAPVPRRRSPRPSTRLARRPRLPIHSLITGL